MSAIGRVLEIKNLTKKYGDKNVVDHINFIINQGEIFGLIGPNGAGKSTTLKMITGLVKSTSGQILVMGKELSKQHDFCLAQIGAIIENPDMYAHMSGLANLKYYASFFDNVDNSAISNVLNIVGMTEKAKVKVSKYSLGMKQKIGLAQALLNKPKLLILDEPTNGLDVNGIIQLRKLLQNLAKEKKVTVLISSHNLAEIQKICTKYAIINNGKIVETKSVSNGSGISFQFNGMPYYIKISYPNFAGKLIKEEFKIDVKIINGNSIVFEANNGILPQITTFLINKKFNIFEFGRFETEDLEKQFLNVIDKNK